MGPGQISMGTRPGGRVIAALAAMAAIEFALALALTTAIAPFLALLSAAVVGAATAVALRRAAAARVAGWAACAGGLAALAAFVGLAPRIAAVAVPGVALGLAGVRAMPGASVVGKLPAAARVLGKAFGAALALASLPVLLSSVAAWPATTVLIAIVALAVVLAWRAPPWALAIGVLLIGFEGSIKILLGVEPTPLPDGNRAAGAAAIDVAIFASVAGVVAADRLETPRRLWARMSTVERRAVALLGAWLALSVVQIFQGGDLVRGLHGFRLFQAYTVLAIAGAAVFYRPRWRLPAAAGLLAVGFAVCAYAAFRVLFGPADAEVDFATSVNSITSYGPVVRAIGSFSSAIGLSSYLAPLVAFGLVVGYLDARLRVLGWTVAALGLVGLVGGYSRASLFGVALGLVAALALLAATANVPRRRKIAGIALIAGVFLATYGGVLVASHTPHLRERARGILDPFSDKSAEIRFRTWRKTLRRVGSHPLGTGVGTVGAASARGRPIPVTTDNSFLKVLLEQGIVGGAIFAAAVLSAIVLLARRLRRAVGESRSIGLAALAGFVTFIGIAATGETVEQPGKVVAWGLLGVAAAQALGGATGVTRRPEGEGA